MRGLYMGWSYNTGGHTITLRILYVVSRHCLLQGHFGLHLNWCHLVHLFFPLSRIERCPEVLNASQLIRGHVFTIIEVSVIWNVCQWRFHCKPNAQDQNVSCCLPWASTYWPGIFAQGHCLPGRSYAPSNFILLWLELGRYAAVSRSVSGSYVVWQENVFSVHHLHCQWYIIIVLAVLKHSKQYRYQSSCVAGAKAGLQGTDANPWQKKVW